MLVKFLLCAFDTYKSSPTQQLYTSTFLQERVRLAANKDEEKEEFQVDLQDERFRQVFTGGLIRIKDNYRVYSVEKIIIESILFK